MLEIGFTIVVSSALTNGGGNGSILPAETGKERSALFSITEEVSFVFSTLVSVGILDVTNTSELVNEEVLGV
jgi:hypothetical protein